MHHADALLLGNLVCLLDESVVVSLVHIREARTGREVLAAQRVFREEVDVVGDNHQVADLELRVHAARSVAYEEGLYAQFVHHADRERNVLHRVALVVVEASLHRHDVLAAELAEDELARVALNGRYGEVRDV